jgi:hypothetical protein
MTHSNYRRHLLSLFLISLLCSNLNGQNRLNSRLFYLKPPLFISKTKIEDFNISKYKIFINLPVDSRSKYYGEYAYKKKKVQLLDEFFQLPTMEEIQRKIHYDFSSFGMKDDKDSSKEILQISSNIEVFYPDVRGFIWAKSFAKVRLILTGTLNEKELINRKYESFYITDGTDKEFEGSMLMTIEEGANVTIGIALRKALDDFYLELKNQLLTHKSQD